MGVFKRTVVSLDAGDSTNIKGPAGTGGIKRIYVTSTNLTFCTVKTDAHVNEVIKSVNTNLQEGYYPLEQSASEITITAFGMGAAENVTISTEWE